MEDPHTEHLRRLIDEAKALQREASALVIEITDRLQRSIWLHTDTVDDRPPRPRRGPRKGDTRKG
ncbi:MAG TPA: hypothetical protein VF456_07695 [Vicinamibacterales bacterium]